VNGPPARRPDEKGTLIRAGIKKTRSLWYRIPADPDPGARQQKKKKNRCTPAESRRTTVITSGDLARRRLRHADRSFPLTGRGGPWFFDKQSATADDCSPPACYGEVPERRTCPIVSQAGFRQHPQGGGRAGGKSLSGAGLFCRGGAAFPPPWARRSPQYFSTPLTFPAPCSYLRAGERFSHACRSTIPALINRVLFWDLIPAKRAICSTRVVDLQPMDKKKKKLAGSIVRVRTVPERLASNESNQRRRQPPCTYCSNQTFFAGWERNKPPRVLNCSPLTPGVGSRYAHSTLRINRK